MISSAAYFVIRGIATIIVLVSCWACGWTWYRKPSINRRGKTVVKLLPVEASIPAPISPSIATVTYYQGDHNDFARKIRARVREILKANPWLTGRLDWSDRQAEEGNFVLVYDDRSSRNSSVGEASKIPPRNAEDDVDEKVLDDHFQHDEKHNTNDTTPSLSFNTPLASVGTAAKPFLVEAGYFCLRDPPNKPLFRVCVVPDAENPKKRFALVVSISHLIADGHTYYQIYNMLDQDASVVSLSPERHTKVMIEAVTKKMGGVEESYLAKMPLGFAFFLLSSFVNVYPVKAEFAAHTVNNEHVTKTKSNHKKNNADEASVPFVSTNDVITSDIMSAARADMGMMAVNFRGRLDDDGPLKDTDAGNYEDLIVYLPPDYAEPALVRRSVRTLRRAVTFGTTSIPRSVREFWSRRVRNLTVVTNWSTFARDVRCAGVAPELHVPVINSGAAPLARTVTICVIFRMNSKGSLGVYLFGNQDQLQRIKNSAVVGDSIK